LSGLGVGLARKEVNDKDGGISNLILYTIFINVHYSYTREVGEATYFGKGGKQTYLLMNHLEKLLAILITAITCIEVAQDGLQAICKLRAVYDL
jgi:hypothetical protein